MGRFPVSSQLDMEIGTKLLIIILTAYNESVLCLQLVSVPAVAK